MCEDCGGICAVLDRMIDEYLRMVDGGRHRRFFHPMEIPGKNSATDSTTLSQFVEQAACIDMTPQELEAELVKRSGFAESVQGWLQEKRVPNGMIRKIILTNAEMIIRERGARPRLTLLKVA